MTITAGRESDIEPDGPILRRRNTLERTHFYSEITQGIQAVLEGFENTLNGGRIDRITEVVVYRFRKSRIQNLAHADQPTQGRFAQSGQRGGHHLGRFEGLTEPGQFRQAVQNLLFLVVSDREGCVVGFGGFGRTLPVIAREILTG